MTKMPKYKMSMSLGVLEHLGINLYSSIPPVLSEAVANAWDADAQLVDITIDNDKKEIIIEDDGQGMTVEDANKKYLIVGYKRRDEGLKITPKFERPVMGRKGIGKLSLFSIAKIVEIHTSKDGKRHGFRMDFEVIKKKIGNKSGQPEYNPEEIPEAELKIAKNNGTVIVLKNLRMKRSKVSEKPLRKRIARRFSIIGEKFNFIVKINGVPIDVGDRDYFKKLQGIWYYGDDSARYADYCEQAKTREKRNHEIVVEDDLKYLAGDNKLKVAGWIGTVNNSGDLKDSESKDNLNKVVLMHRGKISQEDILEDFPEGGLFTKYLIGEIHVDFMDDDKYDDASTSNRQEYYRDEPRYNALTKWFYGELKNIQKQWTKLREKEGEEEALKIDAIREWFDKLQKNPQKKAKALFGKINQLPLDPNEKKEVFKHAVMAFENLRYKENLDALENVSPENLKEFTEIVKEHDDIEATMFHQILRERLTIIEKLQQDVADDVLEKVLQEYLYDHLWLIDPSWDRITETPIMEQTIKKQFGIMRIQDAELTPDEEKGRIDIRYRKTSGKHVIIELKRSSVQVNYSELVGQVDKYRKALKKVIRAHSKDKGEIETICIVGKELSGWDDREERLSEIESLAAKNIRVLLYSQLINDSQKAYQAFLEKKNEAGSFYELLRKIEEA
ncbi:MAG: hypothetical protein GY765_39345 [bacterium]|nr:hypothetical protein [bacterium]